MKKITKLFSVVALIICFCATSAYAKTSSQSDDALSQKSGGYIMVDNKASELYRVFKDQERALKHIKEKYSKEFKVMQRQFKLGELSKDNWEEYYKKLYKSNISHKAMEEIDDFFDIYENQEKNENIKRISLKNSISDKTKREMMALPFDGEDSNSGIVSMSSGSKIANINRAIAYAEKFAWTRNDRDYDSFTQDCTNFVSQILEAGGVNQERYSSEKKGWWHKTRLWPMAIVKHDHSISWIRADTFAKYMGVRARYESHRKFSKYVYRGNIIAFDKQKDGDWNHIAFVTKTDNYEAKYGNKRYYDYKVAQHTFDYHAWTSSNKNGWEKLDGKVYYGVIRYHGTY